MMSITAVILAAGQGTRMKSDLPKVLHQVGGKTMIGWVMDSLKQAGVQERIVVLGHGGAQVEEALQGQARIAWQREQLGTGHAVMQAAPLLSADGGTVLVLCGDTPLLTADTLRRLLDRHQEEQNGVTLLTAVAADPFGYGRILRQQGQITAIVEQKDADEEQQKITEINTGTYCFDQQFLLDNLSKLTTNNAQQEYYLTDLIALAGRQGVNIGGCVLEDFQESLGVNQRVQLAQAEQILRQRKCCALMLQGVTIIDPGHTYIDAQVNIGRDTVIYPGAILQGHTCIGSGNIIGANCRIADSILGDGNEVQQSVLTQCQVGNHCKIGPFAYLRPGTELADGVKIGDFVEVKKSQIGQGSKIPHLSYVGDAIVGPAVNIGCGTITCNYDGVNKHQTVIEAGAFIGSNTNLVAPLTVGQGATVGAGSTITRDVPEKSLAVTRAELKIKENWQRKK